MALYTDVIIAGFGGQGVLLVGNMLAYSAMQEGLQVTYMPVYGVEMRGGTANCTVVISEEEIGSPLVMYPHSLIIMNQPSLEKFRPRLKEGGVQIVNTSIVPQSLLDGDQARSVPVPANDLANELGNPKMANMVVLGAWVEATGILSLERVKQGLPQVLGKSDERIIQANHRAMQAGADRVREYA
ncbi:MAG: 2-oxoacid:acceptor oxidoreductase family protein [Desulfohalobiaceae bacterium]|nr:2-oxoacid:acceptor oxidoreductase family protein [Desulfohalobiaceae bacterium]